MESLNIDTKFPWYQEKVWWPIYRLFSDPLRPFREFKWALQTFFRGYSDFDLWSLDNHLAKLIHKRLVAFRKMHKNGYPACFFDGDNNPMHSVDLPDEFKGKGDEYWESIIDKMIKSFAYINDYTYDIGKTIEEVDRIEEDIKEGLELFAKYFRNLWD